MAHNPLTDLHRFIVRQYNLEDFRTLCFDLGVNYDNLPGETLNGKARELILVLGRQRRFDQLITQLKLTHPTSFDLPHLGTDPAALEALYTGLPAFGTDSRLDRRKSVVPVRSLALLAIVVLTLGMIVLLMNQNGGERIEQTPTPSPTPQPPHAPPIERNSGEQLFDEQTLLLTLGSGEKKELKVMDLWSAPEGTPASCATAYLRFTWQVRDPYPEGGDLEIHRYVPQGGGRTELVERGATGSSIEGWCGDIILYNNSLVDYRVEMRYASGY